MLRYFKLVALLLFTISISANNFITKGNGIRSTIVGQVNGKQVLYISEIDGAISCYSISGKKLWGNSSAQKAVMFELNTADIDGDGNDDVVAASGDGHIYCYKSNGKLLWKFNPGHKVRFSEVAIIKKKDVVQIFAGGNDYQLYEIDAKGKLVSNTEIKGVVRTIAAGNFLSKDDASIFLMTYSHDKFRWEMMAFINPDTKEIEKSQKYKSNLHKSWSKFMVNDVAVADVDKDAKDDILFFGITDVAVYKALNGDFKEVASFVGNKKEKQRYAHTQGTTLLPYKDELVLQFGGIIYGCSLTGKPLYKSGEKYREIIYNDLVFDADSKQLIAGGQVGGGNGIYFYDVKKSNWYQTKQKLQGRMVEVEKNLNTLYEQALDFKMPAYQKKSEKEWVMITGTKEDAKVAKLKGANIKFVLQKSPKENSDRSKMVEKMGKIALNKDKRGNYKETREDIINTAKEFEATDTPFALWAGHGNDPFYIQIETLEEILKVAPNTCYGFIYAEMDDTSDPRVQHYIHEYIPRLAKAIRVNGKAKLYFRYKNMFWALSSHQSLWKELFFSNEYSDILVPASEDTSSRTQDVNLAGRVGMFCGGYVNDFGMRLVDDNPTSWRPLTPGGQRTVSPYLRQGVMMAAYGARYGILFSNNYIEGHGLNILYALMKSGALPIVEKENIVSNGSWHLIKDVDKQLVHTVDNHHNMKQYTPKDEDAVFSVAQMHWAGANVPNHDYSKLLGVDYRWLNYIPQLPYGMIPIAAIESENDLEEKGIPYAISDGKQGFVNGKGVKAKDFENELQLKAEQGAEKMPVLVKDAAWSAIRIDENHIRVILIDQGYIDPQEREASIVFQGKVPSSAIDLFSQEKLKISDNKSELTVPAGALRFIELTY
ncbi:PQQ-binding-like beta-propeller repeat protein [Labilibacter marinus]|uniref:PQQ-binding-like beta-propeller repeat protein n=1 Tax=Labilibacter marinus TaxID=1477105 RepID=UPI0008312D8D|nr:PQQ-binding-like beta-propeller repeat protein [Labilibacter marinus]